MSLRCRTLEGGFSLWKEYCSESERHLHGVPEERRLDLQFEQFVADPTRRLPEICRLAGLDHDARADETVRGMVQRDKAHRYRQDGRLGDFHRRVAVDPQMKSLGY